MNSSIAALSPLRYCGGDILKDVGRPLQSTKDAKKCHNCSVGSRVEKSVFGGVLGISGLNPLKPGIDQGMPAHLNRVECIL
jgi:hypothetical protein